MDAVDQSVLIQEMNQAFRREHDPKEVQYATAALLGYCCAATGELIFTNAGHPPPLWYHVREKTWHWLRDETSYRENRIEGVPLGLLPGTDYLQSAMRLGPGDFVVLFTDGLSESTNDAGSKLGYHGILGLAESLLLQTGTSSSAMGQALLSAVGDFRGYSPVLDDESMMVLQQTMDIQVSYASQSVESEIRTHEERAEPESLRSLCGSEAAVIPNWTEPSSSTGKEFDPRGALPLLATGSKGGPLRKGWDRAVGTAKR
jgi:hypothetical protein